MQILQRRELLMMFVFFIDPRILVEAIKLAFRRGLSIYYRPEVKQGTIARTATAEEM